MPRHPAVAKYALEGLPDKVLAAEYRTALPKEKVFEKELVESRRQLEEKKGFLSSGP